VQQRDFAQGFLLRDYRAQTGHATAYWETSVQGVQAVLSAGQYLAGDKGMTLMVTKVFDNASAMSFYATWTSHATIDKLEPQIEARSNASGLTPPKWLWRLVRL
jgi:hypothetical protein